MSRIHHHHPHLPVTQHKTANDVAWAQANQKTAEANQKTAEALAQLASTFNQGQGIARGGCMQPPPPAYEQPSRCFPPPTFDQCSPPAGEGLKTGGDFGANAVTTAGGYTIVPTGGTNWDIYAPGQKPGDKPMTHVWGDPHVTESDGTRWDFTKNSNFKLPDGTNIAVTTSAQSGQSVTTGLDITNGADRVKVSGVNDKPSLSPITHDGFQARAELAAQDTFRLGGDGKGKVQWFKEVNGKMEGEVVGAQLETKDGVSQYVQKTDPNSQYVVDPSLQPKPGTPAWGNMLRDEAVDAVRNTFGSGSAAAETVARGADQDNTNVMRRQAVQEQMQKIQQLIQQLMRMLSFMNLGGGWGGWGGGHRPPPIYTAI